VEQVGVQALHDRLAQVDPLSASRLPPTDIRRIVRALEVYKITGKPISHLQMQFDEGKSANQCRVFVLDWPRPILHQRIELRVCDMFARGLIDEVQQLQSKYGSLGRTAAQAVGYREVIEHLASCAASQQDVSATPQLIERVTVRTRRFAKRQGTWFRALSECRVIARQREDDVSEIAERIAAG
jgi:tRNA dimethylallyltransferase